MFVTLDGQRGFELPGGRARIGNHRDAAVLTCVRFVDVDINKADVRVLESSFGGSCEIAQPRANGDHKIRLAGRDIRAGRAGNPDGAEILPELFLVAGADDHRGNARLAQQVIEGSLGHRSAMRFGDLAQDLDDVEQPIGTHVTPSRKATCASMAGRASASKP